MSLCIAIDLGNRVPRTVSLGLQGVGMGSGGDGLRGEPCEPVCTSVCVLGAVAAVGPPVDQRAWSSGANLLTSACFSCFSLTLFI